MLLLWDSAPHQIHEPSAKNLSHHRPSQPPYSAAVNEASFESAPLLELPRILGRWGAASESGKRGVISGSREGEARGSGGGGAPDPSINSHRISLILSHLVRPPVPCASHKPRATQGGGRPDRQILPDPPRTCHTESPTEPLRTTFTSREPHKQRHTRATQNRIERYRASEKATEKPTLCSSVWL